MSESRNNFPLSEFSSNYQPPFQNVICFCVYSSSCSSSSLLLHFELDASGCFDLSAAQEKRFDSPDSKYHCSRMEKDSLFFVIAHNKCSLVNLESHVSFFKYSFELTTGERLTSDSLVRKIHFAYEILAKYFLFGARQESSLTKIAASSFFRPNSTAVSTKRGWFGAQTTTIAPLSPHVMLFLHEEMTFLLSANLNNVRVTGALNLHSSSLPSLSTCSLGVDLSGRPNLVPSEDVFIDFTSSSSAAKLDCCLSNENLFLARYDVENISCPLKLKVTVRIRESDKIVETSICCKSELPKNVRMQELKLRFQLPEGTVNAILLGGGTSLLASFSMEKETNEGIWQVKSLFGGAEVDSTISIAVSTVDDVQSIKRRLNNFVCSFHVEDFSFFRICDQSRSPIPVERKTRQRLSCANARINLYTENTP